MPVADLGYSDLEQFSLQCFFIMKMDYLMEKNPQDTHSEKEQHYSTLQFFLDQGKHAASEHSPQCVIFSPPSSTRFPQKNQ